MAVPDTERIYFDSSVYLALLNSEPGRVNIAASLVREAEQGRLQILTSAISLAEVAFFKTEGSTGELAEIDRRIDSLLQNSRVTTLIQFTPGIGVRAREFVRSQPGRRAKLSVLDSIHLASAAAAVVDRFYAYDRDFSPFADVVRFSIGQPEFASPRMDLGGST